MHNKDIMILFCISWIWYNGTFGNFASQEIRDRDYMYVSVYGIFSIYMNERVQTYNFIISLW